MHENAAYLWPGVGNVQIMQCYVLYDFLLLVDITLRQRHIFFRFEVELGGVRVGPALALTRKALMICQN